MPSAMEKNNEVFVKVYWHKCGKRTTYRPCLQVRTLFWSIKMCLIENSVNVTSKKVKQCTQNDLNRLRVCRSIKVKGQYKIITTYFAIYSQLDEFPEFVGMCIYTMFMHILVYELYGIHMPNVYSESFSLDDVQHIYHRYIYIDRYILSYYIYAKSDHILMRNVIKYHNWTGMVSMLLAVVRFRNGNIPANIVRKNYVIITLKRSFNVRNT